MTRTTLQKFAQRRGVKPVAVPAVPSAALRLAVKDLTKAEKSRAYVIDMGTYYERGYSKDGKDACGVCFAGAVMAAVPGQAKIDIAPDMFDAVQRDRLYAMDSFRQGAIYDALQYFKLNAEWITINTNVKERVNVPNYSKTNSAKFKKAMIGIADMLEAAGY